MKCPKIKLIICIALALSVVIAFIQPTVQVNAANTEYMQQYSAVLGHLYAGSEPNFGSVNGEWKVLSLSRSGYVGTDSAYLNAYYSRIEAMVSANGSPILDSRKSTENSRLVIALSSMGRDARNVAGYNLVEPLYNMEYVRKQGINGVVYALIAIGCKTEYMNTSASAQLVDFLLNAEITGGGWALGGNNPDPDITAITLTALAGYEQANKAISRGVQVLSNLQDDDGGYTSFGSPNSESCSQVLTALSTLGIDADSDQRFNKNGNSLLAALLSYVSGDGFSHFRGGQINGMASEQGAYALCAYDRLTHGRNSLFDMRDVGGNVITPAPSYAPTLETDSRPASSEPTQKPTALPMYTTGPTATACVMPTVTPFDAAATAQNYSTPEISICTQGSVMQSSDWSIESDQPLATDALLSSDRPTYDLESISCALSTPSPSSYGGTNQQGAAIALTIITGAAGTAVIIILLTRRRRDNE